jgi:hypothetical protein
MKVASSLQLHNVKSIHRLKLIVYIQASARQLGDYKYIIERVPTVKTFAYTLRLYPAFELYESLILKLTLHSQPIICDLPGSLHK